MGYYNDANDAFHAFLRSPDGKIVTFTDPYECTGADYQGCQGTAFYAINDFGVIAGAYLDTNFVQTGLVVSPSGKVTAYEAPGAGNTPDSTPTNYSFQGSVASLSAAINLWGAITASYIDSNYVYHGFLRSPNGPFTDFDAPDADTTTAGYGTVPASINVFGEITGDYLDANSVYHGFLRNPGGGFTSFDAPSASTAAGSFSGTYPVSINDFGEITGDYLDANDVYHGFVRTPHGTITSFDVPGANTTPGAYGGTFPSSNNTAGVITGYYQDANYVYHGFIRKP